MNPSDFLSKFSTINLVVKLQVDKELTLWISWFDTKRRRLIFSALSFSQKSLDCDWIWIVNPFWKVDLDSQSHFSDGFELDWQSKKSDWVS